MKDSLQLLVVSGTLFGLNTAQLKIWIHVKREARTDQGIPCYNLEGSLKSGYMLKQV